MTDDPAIRRAAETLHDEAHADDKVPWRLCRRQSCKDLQEALTSHWCETYGLD